MGAPVAPEQEPTRGNFTMDNTMLEMREHSLTVRFIAKVAVHLVKKNCGTAHNGTDPQYKMMLVSVLDCPLRAAVICGEGRMKERYARALVHMANGHPLRAFGALLRRY